MVDMELKDYFEIIKIPLAAVTILTIIVNILSYYSISSIYSSIASSDISSMGSSTLLVIATFIVSLLLFLTFAYTAWTTIKKHKKGIIEAGIACVLLSIPNSLITGIVSAAVTTPLAVQGMSDYISELNPTPAMVATLEMQKAQINDPNFLVSTVILGLIGGAIGMFIVGAIVGFIATNINGQPAQPPKSAAGTS